MLKVDGVWGGGVILPEADIGQFEIREELGPLRLDDGFGVIGLFAHGFCPLYIIPPHKFKRNHHRDYSVVKMTQLVVQRALVDPVYDDLQFFWCDLGSAVGHFSTFDQLNQQAIGCITWCENRSVAGSSDQVVISSHVQAFFLSFDAVTFDAFRFEDGHDLIGIAGCP